MKSSRVVLQAVEYWSFFPCAPAAEAARDRTLVSGNVN